LVWKSDAVLVEVFTDQGIVGIGESSPYAGPEFLRRTIEDSVKPALIGKNPFDVEHLAIAWGGTRAAYAAWSGVDAACWDIIGKAKNIPVWRLLATDAPPQPHIRVYASGGVEYAWYRRPEGLIDEAVRHKEEGYTAFKFRIGTEWRNSGMSIKKYIQWVYRLRQAVGPDIDLMQESNMRLTLDECLELCPVLEELNFLCSKSPSARMARAPWRITLRYGRRSARSKSPAVKAGSAGFDFKEWIDRDAYDIVQPDCNVTGLTEAWHIARIAGVRGKHCCPHNWHGGLTTMANATLVAGIPNRLVLELNHLQSVQGRVIQRPPRGAPGLPGPVRQARLRSGTETRHHGQIPVSSGRVLEAESRPSGVIAAASPESKARRATVIS
jgi:galactonate dehydratase